MTMHSAFGTDTNQNRSPFSNPNPSPFEQGSPFGQPSGGSPFGQPAGSSPFGNPGGGPLRPRRRGIGPGTIIVATLIPVVASIGIVLFVGRQADKASTEARESVQEILDRTLPAGNAPAAPVAPVVPAISVPANLPGTAEEAAALADEITAAVEEALPGATTAGTTAGTNSGSLLENGSALVSIVDQVAAARGASDLMILSATIYPDWGSFSVQDPTIPENVDNYAWRGGRLGDPIPVQLFGDGDLDASVFAASEVDWSAISELVAQAPDAVSVEGGVVTHVHVERALPFSSDIQVRVFVNGTRDSGFVDGTADGTMISINGN